MGSVSKHQKVEKDRISNLPTSLISHILSLLPTKYAVRTSSLSTFWYQQWTSVTQLHFDDTLAPDFLTFVYRVLLHLKVGCLDVFQLNCSQDYGVKHINSWVSAALSRHVQHLDLTFSTVEPGLLPRSVYFSRNLVVLKLGTGFLLKVPMSISLDSLKILHLSVQFSDNDSLSRLVSSCPVLEELKLRGIVDGNVNIIEISAVTLKRLILIGLNPLSEPQSHSYRVVLNSPGLQYLEYLDSCFPDSFSKGILHCLNIAHIDVGPNYGRLQVFDFDYLRRARCALALFAIRISNTKFLHFSKDACQAFHFTLSRLPKFTRLIELELYEANGEFLSAFLARSPNLATLTFRYSYYFTMSPVFPPQTVPLCMLSSLKKIEIKNFRGQDEEMEIVRYFLEKSTCLNKLLISYPLEVTKEKEAKLSEKLLMLPRASTSCIVVIT